MSRTLVPNVTSGGIAMPIGRNMYYMRGKKHKDGGIVIGNKTNGLEVEDGEVVKLDNGGTKVYSSMPLLNGNSPAQLVLNGFQPNKVFNAQERYKNNVGLKDDGTTKYAGGGSHPYGRVSENGINLIRSFEGYMPRVYRDSGGVETIGYGETDKNFINKYRATGISRQDADAQLRNRAQWFYDGVAKRTKGWDKLNQQQRDALTSYAYNIGLGGYGAHKNLLGAIERGDYEKAALNINAGFNDARNPGLKKRRIKERNLFIQGAVGIKSNINPTEPPVVSNPEFDKLVTPNNPLIDKFMKIKTLYDMTNNMPKFRAGGVHKAVPLGWQMSSDGKYVQTTYGNGSIKRIQVRPGQTPKQAINEYGAKQNKEYDAKVDKESFGKKALNFVVDGLGFDSRGDDTGFHLDPNGKGGYKVRNVHMNHAPIEETIVAGKVLGKPIEAIGNHLVKPALKWIGKRAIRGAIKGTNEEILRYVPKRFRPKIANFADDAVVDSKLGVKEAESVGAKGKRGIVNKGSRSKTNNTTNSTKSSSATNTAEGTTNSTNTAATENTEKSRFRTIIDHVKNNKKKYATGAIGTLGTGVGVYNMNRNPDRTPHGTNYVEDVTPPKPTQKAQPSAPNNTNADTTHVDFIDNQTPQTAETTNNDTNRVVIRNPNVSVTKEQPAQSSTTNSNTSTSHPTRGNASVTRTNTNPNNTTPTPQNNPAGANTTATVNNPSNNTLTPQSNGTNVGAPPSTGKLQDPSGVGTTPTSTNADVVQFNRASGNNSLFGNTGPIRVSGGTYTVGQRKGHYDSNGNPVFDIQNVNIDGKDVEAFVPYTKGSGDNKTIIPSKKFTMSYDSYRLPTINELRDAGDKTLNVSRAANDVLMQNYLKENLYNGKTKDIYGKTIDANYKPETPSSKGKISLWDRFKALDDGTKSDIIGIGANSLASVAGFINNAAMLNGLQEPIAPAPAYAAKLKTTVNVAPQLNTVDSSVNRMISDTNDNTASSNVAASRNIAARLTGMANKNQIYGNKENAETELINKDKLNQQEVYNANALQYNQYLNNLVAFRNNVADKRSENINGLINGLNSGVQDFLTKREQRTNFRNTIKASLVSNPDAALLMGNAFKGLLPESFMQTLYNRQAEAEEMKRRELQKRLTAMDAIKGAADKLNVQ